MDLTSSSQPSSAHTAICFWCWQFASIIPHTFMHVLLLMCRLHIGLTCHIVHTCTYIHNTHTVMQFVFWCGQIAFSTVGGVCFLDACVLGSHMHRVSWLLLHSLHLLIHPCTQFACCFGGWQFACWWQYYISSLISSFPFNSEVSIAHFSAKVFTWQSKGFLW
jgi:hypothetical protein